MTFAEVLLNRKWSEIQLSHWNAITERHEQFKRVRSTLRAPTNLYLSKLGANLRYGQFQAAKAKTPKR